MSCLVEHYERQITLNTTVIVDAYESLDKIEGWTERDKQQLEEEVLYSCVQINTEATLDLLFQLS